MQIDKLIKSRAWYQKGLNVAEHLREELNLDFNTSEIIEVAYEMQAGSYIEQSQSNAPYLQRYVSEMASIIDKYILSGENIMDVGTGEMTTLTCLLNTLRSDVRQVLCCDISWSRLYLGKKFLKREIQSDNLNLTSFVGDIGALPLASKSIDTIISNHALEPNRDNLPQLISELFRVARKRLILFEPSYEHASAEGKERMDKHRYIKGIENVVKKLGGQVLHVQLLKNRINSLNPSCAYIISPPLVRDHSVRLELHPVLTIPGTDYFLTKIDNFLFSEEIGVAFPILKKIPILRQNSHIIASSLSVG